MNSSVLSSVTDCRRKITVKVIGDCANWNVQKPQNNKQIVSIHSVDHGGLQAKSKLSAGSLALQ